MSKTGDWLLTLQEEAASMTKEDFLKKNGKHTIALRWGGGKRAMFSHISCVFLEKAKNVASQPHLATFSHILPHDKEMWLNVAS